MNTKFWLTVVVLVASALVEPARAGDTSFFL